MGTTLSTPSLYGHGASLHVRLVLWYCAEADVDFEFVETSWEDIKGDNYLAYVNPLGLMPGLRDADLNVFESGAIIRYLAAKYPNRIYPLTDPVRLGPIDSAYEYIRQNPWLPMNRLFIQLVSNPQIRRIPTDPDKVQLLYPDVSKYFKIIEQAFFRNGSPFVVGDELSIADISLGILVHQLSRCPPPFNDLEVFPKIVKWWKVVSESEGFKEMVEMAFKKERGSSDEELLEEGEKMVEMKGSGEKVNVVVTSKDDDWDPKPKQPPIILQ